MVKEVWPATVRGHVVDGPQKPGGAQLTSQMLAEVKKHPNITFMTNTKVIELKKSATLRCTGAIAVSKTEGALDIDSKCGVVVATGGFHANKEMICKYMGGGVARMPLRGSAFMMGENITLTKPFFPNLVNMDQFHGGPIGVNQANPSTMVNYGVIVNKSAQRIIDEEKTYVAVAKELPLLTKNNWAFIIIDSQVKDIDTVATRIARYEKAKAPIARGSTIAELARSMGVKEKNAREDHRRLQRGREGREGRSAHAPQHARKAPTHRKGPLHGVCLPGRHDGHLRRPEDRQKRRGSERRKSAGSGALRLRQCDRRALLLRLHRGLAAHRCRDLGPALREGSREGPQGLIFL